MRASTSSTASTMVPTIISASQHFQALLFLPLTMDGNNYLLWAKMAKVNLFAEQLSDAIMFEESPTTSIFIFHAISWKGLLFFRRHFVSALQYQYLEIEDLTELWKNLKSRFDHQKTIFLPRARHNWIHLCVLDFPNLNAFNSEMYSIISQLRLCGQSNFEEEMIEKTLSTFPPASVVLAQQYRNMKFQSHSDLMSYLLLTEKQNELLLCNAEARPIGTTILESHTLNISKSKKKLYKHGKRAHKYQGNHSQDHFYLYGKNKHSTINYSRKQKSEMRSCHKCGMIGNLAHACRTSGHFIKMFQENKKLRAEAREVHTIDASMDSIGVDDLEAYMTNRTSNDESNDALIDSTTTHTILSDRRFFIEKSSTWQTKNMMTIAGANTFCFQDGTMMVK